jgi:hypothetical protein
VLKGGLAAVFAAILLVLLTGFLESRVPEVVALPVSTLLAFLAFGAFLGGLGSLVSMQGFLRKW